MRRSQCAAGWPDPGRPACGYPGVLTRSLSACADAVDDDMRQVVVDEFVQHLAARPLAVHHPGRFEDPQMLADQRLGDTAARRPVRARSAVIRAVAARWRCAPVPPARAADHRRSPARSATAPGPGRRAEGVVRDSGGIGRHGSLLIGNRSHFDMHGCACQMSMPMRVRNPLARVDRRTSAFAPAGALCRYLRIRSGRARFAYLRIRSGRARAADGLRPTGSFRLYRISGSRPRTTTGQPRSRAPDPGGVTTGDS